MLKSARIQNFRCLHDITLEFSPLTVLVGANASGKSSVLSALDINQLRSREFPWTENTWRKEQGKVVIIETKRRGSAQSSIFRWGPPSKGIQESGDVPLKSKKVRLDLRALRTPNLLQYSTELAPDGSNLTNVFETLERNMQVELAGRLCQLVPMFKDVQARTYPGLAAGQKILQFQDRWSEDVWHRADEVSDGTMLLLAYLVLKYQKAPLDLICVEEPERGIHPCLLGKLVEFLRGVAEGGGRHGQKMNMLLATHSPELLNFLRPTEVRFLRIGDDGATQIESPPTTSPHWEIAFREYRNLLGEAWLSGGLGGVPGVPA